MTTLWSRTKPVGDDPLHRALGWKSWTAPQLPATMATVALRASVVVLLVGVQALPAMRSWVSMLVQGAVEVPR